MSSLGGDASGDEARKKGGAEVERERLVLRKGEGVLGEMGDEDAVG